MQALDWGITALARFNDLFARIAKYISLVLIAVMTLSVLVQVFFRFGLNSALSWTEEASIYMMIWMAFLVAPFAYRSGANVSIEIIRDLFKGRAKWLLQIVLTAIVLYLLIILFDKSIAHTANGLRSNAKSIPMKMIWVYVAMPIGIGGMIVVSVELLLRSLRHLIDPAAPVDHLPPHPDPLMTGVAPNPPATAE